MQARYSGRGSIDDAANYRIMLEVNEPERLLYLAVPVEAYDTFFQSRFAQVAVERHLLRLISDVAQVFYHR